MKIVVIGSGIAAVTLVDALSKRKFGELTIVTSDTLGYYARPRLSHGVSLTDEAVDAVVLRPFGRFPAPVHILAGERVTEIDGKTYVFVLPVRSQETWLTNHLMGSTEFSWTAPAISPIIKIHGFNVPHES